MSLKITVRPEAEAEIQEAYDWYNLQYPGLGDEFLDHVDVAFEKISQYPNSAPIVYRDIRRYLVERFPHSILYIVEPTLIVVLAVYHGRRSPVGWKDRR